MFCKIHIWLNKVHAVDEPVLFFFLWLFVIFIINVISRPIDKLKKCLVSVNAATTHMEGVFGLNRIDHILLRMLGPTGLT